MDTNTANKGLFDGLAAYFPPTEIRWRVGNVSKRDPDNPKGAALAYVDSRSFMDRLDAVLGPDLWHDEYKAGPNGGILCGLSIKINGEWVTKWDGADNTQFEGVKGGISDSFKRACVKWGIARYLYAFPMQWVAVKPVGKGYVLAGTPIFPKWAIPAGEKEVIVKEESLEVPVETVQEPPTTEPEGKKETVTPGNGKGNGNNGNDSSAVEAAKRMARAQSYTIPSGLPFEGFTMGDVLKESIGRDVIEMLAGHKDMDGKKFVPADDEQKKTQAAAEYLSKTLATVSNN